MPSTTRWPSSPAATIPAPPMRSTRWPPAATSGRSTSSSRSRTATSITHPDGKAYIKDGAEYLDAATGEAGSPAKPDGIKKIRVNNRMRNAIAAALGALQLMSPDPAQAQRRRRGRLQVRATPPPCRRWTRRSPPRRTPTSSASRSRRAPPSSSTMNDASEEDKLAAVAVIRDRGDQDALALLHEPAGGHARDGARRRRQGDRRHQGLARSVGRRCRTSGTACRSARCCCSPPSASPSPSASWASSTWPMARW